METPIAQPKQTSGIAPKVKDVSDRASDLVRSIQERAWKVAHNAGIPRDGCCLHNASIDYDLKYWCADNPERLKAAKRATRMMRNAWAISDLADRIERRAFNKAEGRVRLEVRPLREPINVKLLFSKV